jgi:serine/threonine protein kinase
MLASSDDRAPTVKVLDMGLALLQEPVSPAPGELTMSGSIMGTLEFMSPEQSQNTHLVDIRAKTYSLGATLYNLLRGQAPFSGERFNTRGKMLVKGLAHRPAADVSRGRRTKRHGLPRAASRSRGGPDPSRLEAGQHPDSGGRWWMVEG